MGNVVTPDLTDETTSSVLDEALTEVDPQAVEALAPANRRRLRDLLRPQANGDQDGW